MEAAGIGEVCPKINCKFNINKANIKNNKWYLGLNILIDKINGLTLKHGSFVFDHKMFPNFVIGRSIIAAMKKIKNVKVEGLDDIEICMASTRGGQCGPCRSCWDKSVKNITYKYH